MSRPTRHVVFHPSARGSLRQALKALGRREEVVALFDDLQCGPIHPLDLDARQRWFDATLGVDFEPALVPQWHSEFWPSALDGACRLVAWTTRHNAQDRLGYMLWASQLGEVPGEVVDVSDVVLGGAEGELRPAVPLIAPKRFVELELFDRAKLVSADEKVEAARELARLGREDGAFRQTRNGEIVTLPLTAFDETLVAASGAIFRKAAFVIGTAIFELLERHGWHVSDLVLAARLTALVELGRLEAQGDPHGSIRYYEVRLPSR